jgi:ParB-like chromosome segregation protein Spo0J
MTHEIHEAAHIFPMEEETLGELADDIRQNGLLVPVQLMGGLVIDGRRRLEACRRAGVEPRFCDVDVTDPISHVVSLNLKRRHLDTGQRSMIAVRVMEMYETDAKRRQREHARTAPGRPKTLQDNCPEVIRGQSRDKAGEALGVSGKSVDRAAKVLAKAVPEIIEAVDQGKIAVDAAAKVADMPPEVQREVAKSPETARSRIKEIGNIAESGPAPAKRTPDAPDLGIRRANEAIDRLKLIARNDRFRRRGFQIVRDWIKENE